MYRTISIFFMACMVTPQFSQADFIDVTASSGVNEFKESWGVVSCDWNKDGHIDILLNNHRDPLSLYRNNGDGTFTNDTALVNNPVLLSDEHGIVCADFYPNDSYLEFVVTTGGAHNQPSMLRKFFKFDDQTGQYEDIADIVNFQIKENPGRSLLVTDYNGDNRLDIFESARKKSAVVGSAVYEYDNVSNSFIQLSGVLNNACENNVVLFSKYTDLDQDHIPEIACIGQTLSHGLFEIENGFFNDIWPQVSPSPAGAKKYNPIRDVAIADFNGDNRTDIFALGRDSWPANAYMEDGEIRSRIITRNNAKGFHFGGGNQVVTLDFAAPRLNHKHGIFYGQNQETDPSFTPPWVKLQTVQLDPADPRFWGEPTIGAQEGVYIWYDQVTERWHITLSSVNRLQLDTHHYASNDLAGLVLDFDPDEAAHVPLLLENNGPRGFIDVATQSGFSQIRNGLAVETADFDNDGDYDLYLVLSNSPKDDPDEYYENDGAGNFRLKQTLPALPVGSGENLSVADYNQDGCLDIVVVNGHGEQPNNRGPVQIMHGQCPTANNWVQFDLDGTGTVPHGLGATVEVIAPNKTFSKLQDGGARLFGQNAQRLHFGLGEYITTVDVVVYWANGVVTHYSDIAVDSIYSLALDGSVTPVGGGVIVDGQPKINRAVDNGWFIWRENGEWHNKFVASGTSKSYEGGIASSELVTNLSHDLVEINTTDKLITYKNDVYFNLTVTGPWHDSFSFVTTPNAETCVYLKSPANENIYLGPNRVSMPSAFILETQQHCNAPVKIESYGRPSINRSVDNGVFIWQPQPHTNKWRVEAVSGLTRRIIDINLNSEKSITDVQLLDIESNDAINIMPMALNFSLNIIPPWKDSFTFYVQDESNSCIKSTTADVPIFVGPDRINVGESFNLQTFIPCP